MSAPRAKVIVNPVAGGGATRRKWPLIRELLIGSGLSFDYEYTQGVGHGIELARAAVGDGYELVVSVGGDGTANEVANGLIDPSGTGRATLGIIPTGTGADFARSIGIPRDLRDACSLLTGGRRLMIDVGVIEIEGGRRLFINQAAIGFTAEVVETTRKQFKLLGGTVPYVIALLVALASYRKREVTLSFDGRSRSGRVLSVVFSNGAYFGGGMRVAPGADLSDGLLDVVIVGDVGRVDFILTFPTVYSGTHLSHPKVSLERTANIKLDSPERPLIEADGELIGEAPARFSVLPAALSVVI